MNDQTQKAVAEFRNHIMGQRLRAQVESIITAFTAELEAAQREINSARAESKLHAQQRDQAQAACGEMRELIKELRMAVMYDPYTQDERSATDVKSLPLVRKADKALALPCGTSWKSPAEYAALADAARALVNRLEYVHNDGKYQAVWMLAHCHNGPYEGPQYVDQLDVLRKVLT